MDDTHLLKSSKKKFLLYLSRVSIRAQAVVIYRINFLKNTWTFYISRHMIYCATKLKDNFQTREWRSEWDFVGERAKQWIQFNLLCEMSSCTRQEACTKAKLAFNQCWRGWRRFGLGSFSVDVKIQMSSLGCLTAIKMLFTIMNAQTIANRE